MRTPLLFFLVFVSVHSLTGQEIDSFTFYISAEAGWSIPVSNTTNGSPLEQVGALLLFERDGERSIERPLNTRGGGFKSRLNFGYWVSEHLGVELGFHYLRSLRVLDAERNESDDQGRIFYGKQESWSSIFSLNPAVRITGDRFKRVAPYARVGLLLPMVGYTFADISLDDETGSISREILPVIDEEYQDLVESFDLHSESEITTRTSGQFSLGFTAAAGLQIRVNKRMAVISEVGFDMLTIKAKQTEILTFNAGDPGRALLEFTEDDIPPFLQVTEYVDEITETSNDTYDINEARFNRDKSREDLVFRSTYNNAYLNCGILFSF